MTRRDISSASLDEVLTRYVNQASEFNPEVLQRLIDQYPQHADALRRYAHVQLVSLPATPEEIEREGTPDEELLPMQSKLLLRMQLLRAASSAEQLHEAEKKLAAIKGKQAISEATHAVFGGTKSGETALFLCVIDPPGVHDAPGWFSEALATHMRSQVAAVQLALTKRQSGRGRIRLQKFRARERPKDTGPRSWSQAVAETITDSAVRERILRRT